ncbi:hypothetical protein V6Z11_D09G175400 [Gossypium hirsutum]
MCTIEEEESGRRIKFCGQDCYFYHLAWSCYVGERQSKAAIYWT